MQRREKIFAICSKLLDIGLLQQIDAMSRERKLAGVVGGHCFLSEYVPGVLMWLYPKADVSALTHAAAFAESNHSLEAVYDLCRMEVLDKATFKSAQSSEESPSALSGAEQDRDAAPRVLSRKALFMRSMFTPAALVRDGNGRRSGGPGKSVSARCPRVRGYAHPNAAAGGHPRALHGVRAAYRARVARLWVRALAPTVMGVSCQSAVFAATDYSQLHCPQRPTPQNVLSTERARYPHVTFSQ